jgi:hypothetical protein
MGPILEAARENIVEIKSSGFFVFSEEHAGEEKN